ncbi:para-nitrobenzyl esterase [Spirosomataceae bacterium TFI 002]|nr:para-nitrobenzyl esterase [Spirosomataceae bacterium TFI 002]
MKTTLLLALFLTILYNSSFAQNNAFAVQTSIKNGIVEGNYDTKTGIQKYFGIPYAKPPVGDFRWKAPQPIANWQGVKMTKDFGPRAMQAPVFGDMRFRSDGLSEDCLYLNVWAPSGQLAKNLPVLVYFYGGGFVAGDGSEPRYDGEAMAKEGIVVVTVNYRLNIFGFFAHPELSNETTYKGSGNYGLMDQALALKWVNENIKVFGGDPKRVTIAGESAGSISVCAQMASPLARNLIAGAIGESGAAINPTLSPIPLKEAEQGGLDFAKSIGQTTLQALRKLSTKEIYEFYNESNRFGFPTVIDGYFYPKTIPQIFNAKEQSQVPLLLGWNSAEIPGQAFMQGQPYKSENYITKVKQSYPTDYEEVLKLYPHGSEREIELSATALASDRFISYSTWKWFDLHRKNSNQPVYRYLFSRVRPPLVDQSLTSALAGGTVKKDPNATPPPPPVGASHASEIEYCMGNLSNSPEFAWTSDDYKVSETMMKYFANFIKTGNPNGENLPEWSKAEPNDKMPPVMNIDLESKTIKAQDDARYEFLDKAYGN